MTLDVRKHFLSQGDVDSWNALPSERVTSETFAEFKHSLDTSLNKTKSSLYKYRPIRKPLGIEIHQTCVTSKIGLNEF